MTRTVERTISAQIPAPPAEVRAYYVDLNNLATLHPLIVSVTVIADTVTGGRRDTTYRIKDLVPLGVVRLPVTYTATMRVPAQGLVSSEANQSPGVRLRSTVSFDALAGGTRLTESLRISAPRPLLGLTVRRAVAAHTEMLDGLRRHFGG